MASQLMISKADILSEASMTKDIRKVPLLLPRMVELTPAEDSRKENIHLLI